MLDFGPNLLIFAQYGSWEAGNSLKILSRGVGTFSTIENFIPRTCIFRRFFSHSGPSQLDARFPNLVPKNAPTVPLSIGLTHPERCATNLCAWKCQKFFGISHQRPNRDQNDVTKCLQNCPQSPVLAVGCKSCGRMLLS